MDQPGGTGTAEAQPAISDEPGLVGSVAPAIADALLAATHGDRDRAWQQWQTERAAIDDAVARRLQEQPTDQGRALFALVGAALASGHGDIEALIRRARDEAGDPRDRADAHRALAKVGTWRGDMLRTAALTERAAMEVAAHDSRREVELYLDATTTLLASGHLSSSAATARRAVTAARHCPDLAAPAHLLHGLVAALSGRDDGIEIPDSSVLDALGDDDVRFGVLVGGHLVSAGRHHRARQLLGRTEAVARATAPDTMPFVLTVVADLGYRAGWWRSGLDAAEEGETMARRSASRNVLALLLVRAARFDAARGDRESCLARLVEVNGIEHAAGLINARLHAASVRALLAAGQGDHEVARAHAELARHIAGDMGLVHPGYDDFHGDLIEALVRTGDLERAGRAVDELEAVATDLAHAPTLAVCARGRLLLADPADVEHWARVAAHHHDLVPMPFERARTHLVLGERRRRAGHRREARLALEKAHAEFVRLGARPWAARSLAELRAAGGRPADRSGTRMPASALSPQEQQVVRVVADGATNKEAASALFLSQKSVERHLTSVYRKLGLRSRTELALWFDSTVSAEDRLI